MTNTINLETLDPREFMGMTPKRKAAIEAAATTPIPAEYPINKVARAMHPALQHTKIASIDEHLGAKSFTLVPNPEKGTDQLAYFSAGEYVAVHLNINGATTTKPYSISSCPREALEGRYTLTVKHTEGGFASEHILTTWHVGDEVSISGPQGQFTYEKLRDAHHIVGLAGGSGVTPFYSLACAIAEGIEDCELTLLYGCRTLEDMLFKAEFEKLAERCNAIKVMPVLSEAVGEGCEQGFITAELIQNYAPDVDYSLFVCGPQAMYDFVDKEIEKLSLPSNRIRHELYGEFKHPELEADYPKDTAGKVFTVTVDIRDTKQEIVCDFDSTLLVAMEMAGIPAPALCRSGECGFCHSRLVSGEVFVPKSVDGRRQADLKFGYIHPCCTFPLSDVEIDVPVE